MTPTPSNVGTGRIRPKHWLFFLIASMMLVVLMRECTLVRFLADSQHPLWKHYGPFKWWLAPHAIAAAITLVTGPLQFSSRLRRRHLNWHRISGRLYVVGVTVGAPLGIVIEAIKYRIGVATLRLLVGTIGFGTIFLTTTVLGFVLARRGRIAEHQRWMMRSFAVAMVFLEVRCAEAIPWIGRVIEKPSNFLETHHVSDLWLYLAVSLTVAELILRYALRKRRSFSAVAQA